ncbi:hypothetical protein [Streptomyces sp. NPDC001661]
MTIGGRAEQSFAVQAGRDVHDVVAGLDWLVPNRQGSGRDEGADAVLVFAAGLATGANLAVVRLGGADAQGVPLAAPHGDAVVERGLLPGCAVCLAGWSGVRVVTVRPGVW